MGFRKSQKRDSRGRWAKSGGGKYSRRGRVVGGAAGIALGSVSPGTVGISFGIGTLAGAAIGHAVDLRVARKGKGK